MTTKTGQCVCGAVSFTAKNVPSDFGACYCDMCKRWSGSQWMGVHVANDDLAIKGQDAIKVFKSSGWAERAFCGTCGSNLWYQLTAGPNAGSKSIGIGLLDDTSDMKVAREFFVDRKTAAYDFTHPHTQLSEAQVLAMFAPSKGDGA